MARLTKTPLWKCPKCGHRFVTKNLWHSCGRYRLADHFRGKPRVVRQTFNHWVALAKSFGPVTVYALKTRIVIQCRVRFAGAVVRSNSLDATLWLMHRVTHPLLTRSESFGKLGYGHHFCLQRPQDIGEALGGLMREAYLIGQQEHLKSRH